jgi:cell division protein FtsW
VVLGLVAGLVLIEPDMGTTICIVLIGSAVIFASGASLLHLAAAGGLAAGAGWLAIQGASYRADRLLAYKDPWAYYDTIGYQPIHSLYALGSGGLFGEGLGLGRQKFEWLPFAHTDAIMAVVGEELGLVGGVLLLLGFVTIAFRGFRIAARIQDPFGSLLAVGITSWIVLQALLNIAVVSTLVPFTGVTLPFISYGGSSLTMTMVASAVLLNLSRHTAPRDVEERDDVRDFSVRELVAGLAYVPVALWRRNRGTRVSGAGRRESAGERGGSFAVGQPLSGTWRKRASSRSGPLGGFGARARGRSRARTSAVRRERGWHGGANRRS